MAISKAVVRLKYLAGLQAAGGTMMDLQQQLDQLADLYTGAGLAGTFLAVELEADPTAKHLSPADVAASTADLAAIRNAVTVAIRQRTLLLIGGIS